MHKRLLFFLFITHSFYIFAFHEFEFIEHLKEQNWDKCWQLIDDVDPLKQISITVSFTAKKENATSWTTIFYVIVNALGGEEKSFDQLGDLVEALLKKPDLNLTALVDSQVSVTPFTHFLSIGWKDPKKREYLKKIFAAFAGSEESMKQQLQEQFKIFCISFKNKQPNEGDFALFESFLKAGANEKDKEIVRTIENSELLRCWLAAYRIKQSSNLSAIKSCGSAPMIRYPPQKLANHRKRCSSVSPRKKVRFGDESRSSKSSPDSPREELFADGPNSPRCSSELPADDMVKRIVSLENAVSHLSNDVNKLSLQMNTIITLLSGKNPKSEHEKRTDEDKE